MVGRSRFKILMCVRNHLIQFWFVRWMESRYAPIDQRYDNLRKTGRISEEIRRKPPVN